MNATSVASENLAIAYEEAAFAEMPPFLAETLRAIATFAIPEVVLAVPFPLPEQMIRRLLADKRLVRLLVVDPPKSLLVEFSDRLKRYAPTLTKQDLPNSSRSTLVFAGVFSVILLRLLTAAARKGVLRTLVYTAQGWKRRFVWSLLASFYASTIYARFARIPLQKLDQWGRHSRFARRLGQLLNGDSSLGRHVTALADLKSYEGKGVVFYTGSLGAGGAERQMVNTILGLQERGIGPLHVICAVSADGFYRPLLDAAGITVELLPAYVKEQNLPLGDLDVETVRHLAAFPRDLAQDSLLLQARLKLLRPQVLHCWQDHCNISGGMAALLAGVPRVVLSARSLAPYHFGFYQVNQRPVYRALHRCGHITILNNSEAGAADYANWLGIPEWTLPVLHNGVDASRLQMQKAEDIEGFRSVYGIPSDAPVVGTIFTLYPVKRPLLWLDAARIVAANIPQAHFLMVGDGVMRSEIENRIIEYGLRDRVHLTGRIANVALPLAAMQAFLLTSRLEGLPNVLLEAQIMGVPVVTVAVGGASEAVDHGATGLVVEQETAAALADAIMRVLREPEWRQCSIAGPAFVERCFGHRRMIEETLNSYGIPLDYHA